jgi:hypothetical protein
MKKILIIALVLLVSLVVTSKVLAVDIPVIGTQVAGPVSFLLTTMYMNQDIQGNVRFSTKSETFEGSIEFGRYQDCPISITHENGTTLIICITDVTSIETNTLKSHREKFQIVGFGHVSPSSDIVIFDATGTFNETLNTISIRCKISGGRDDYIFRADFRSTLK